MSHSLTHSDTLDSDRRRSLAMEMEVGDDGAAGPLQLGYYNHQTASPTANVTRATHASPAPVPVHSLHTGVRQRCACVFLVVFDEAISYLPW